MKKIIAMLLALVMALSLTAVAFAAEEAEVPEVPEYLTSLELPEFTTIEEGKLIMSTNASFPPYEMVADGEGFAGTGFEGIDVEIAWYLAQATGLELVIDDMGDDTILGSVAGDDTAIIVLRNASAAERLCAQLRRAYKR